MKTIYKVTKHATSRMQERLNIPPKQARNKAIKAYKNGLHVFDTYGALRHYLNDLYISYGGKANRIKIYEDTIYVFHYKVLLTVLYLPDRYKPVVEKIAKRKTKWQ